MERRVLSIDARMLFSSGIGVYLQNMLKRIRFEPMGVSVEIYTYNQEGADWIRQYQPEAKVHQAPVWIYGYKEQLYWLKNLRGGAFWSPHFNIPWRGYERLVATVHDCFPLSPTAMPLMKAYGKLMYGRIRKKADLILTVSEFSRRQLQERARIINIPIHAIHNGVNPNWFTSSLPARPYPFRYIVYVGNIKTHKNLPRLLHAWAKIKPELKLICLGHFKNLKLRDEKANRLLQTMKDSVITTDWVDDETLRATVKHAEGLVLPSLYEGFGMPPLEAMASRVPALVSDSSALPEICGDHALYCDPTSIDSIADGLTRLINLQGAERARRIAGAFEHASTFNWDTAAQKTNEAFKSFLA